MTEGRQNQTRFRNWMFLLYLIFFASIIFSFRAVTSISIGAILLFGLLAHKIETGNFISKKLFNLFVVSCLLYYLFQFAGFLYTKQPAEQWSALRLKSALVFLPVAVSTYQFIDQKKIRTLLTGYCLILLVASLCCLTMAIVNYSNHSDLEVFFYHQLVKPIAHHAIQFSILVCVALVFLFEGLARNQIVFTKYIQIILIVFFSAFIVLLSSKLVIGFYLLYIIYFLFVSLKQKNTNRKVASTFIIVFLTIAILVLATKNPVSQRFNDVIKGNIGFIAKDKFNPGDYFNGVQFRLLQWRFVSDILKENQAWLMGVSTAEAQDMLDKKYVAENMYIGEAYRNDRGFLGYNTHNQFLESLLQCGIIGAILFLVVCFSMIKMAWERKNRLLSFVTILLLLYSLTESVFETQYSLVLFIFFPLFLYTQHQNE